MNNLSLLTFGTLLDSYTLSLTFGKLKKHGQLNVSKESSKNKEKN